MTAITMTTWTRSSGRRWPQIPRRTALILTGLGLGGLGWMAPNLALGQSAPANAPSASLEAAPPSQAGADAEAIASPAPRQVDPATLERARAWARDLASDDWAKREAAQESLADLGADALPVIGDLVRGTDPEAAWRGRIILEQVAATADETTLLEVLAIFQSLPGVGDVDLADGQDSPASRLMLRVIVAKRERAASKLRDLGAMVTMSAVSEDALSLGYGGAAPYPSLPPGVVTDSFIIPSFTIPSETIDVAPRGEFAIEGADSSRVPPTARVIRLGEGVPVEVVEAFESGLVPPVAPGTLGDDGPPMRDADRDDDAADRDASVEPSLPADRPIVPLTPLRDASEAPSERTAPDAPGDDASAGDRLTEPAADGLTDRPDDAMASGEAPVLETPSDSVEGRISRIKSTLDSRRLSSSRGIATGVLGSGRVIVSSPTVTVSSRSGLITSTPGGIVMDESGRGFSLASSQVQVTLPAAWRGEASDLKLLSDLAGSVSLSLLDRTIDDAELEALESLPVTMLSIAGSQYNQAALRSLHGKRPDLFISVNSTALLGVSGADVEQGWRVDTVGPESGADEAGIQVGDIVTAIDETPIRTFLDLQIAVGSYRPGDTIAIHFKRGPRLRTLDATLKPRAVVEEAMSRARTVGGAEGVPAEGDVIPEFRLPFRGEDPGLPRLEGTLVPEPALPVPPPRVEPPIELRK